MGTPAHLASAAPTDRWGMSTTGAPARRVQRTDGFIVSFWDILWLLVWSFFFLSYLLVLFNILGDLFRDHELSGVKKALWVVFLLLLPAITAIVYLVVRGKGMAGRAVAQAQQHEEAARAYIREAAGTRSPAEEIANAKALLDSGAISQDEFELLKSRTLGVG